MKIQFQNDAQEEKFEEYLCHLAKICGHLDHHGENLQADLLAKFIRLLRDKMTRERHQ